MISIEGLIIIVTVALAAVGHSAFIWRIVGRLEGRINGKVNNSYFKCPFYKRNDHQ